MVELLQHIQQLCLLAKWLVRTSHHPVDLNPLCAAIHGGCMGVPQEIVDHIMEQLHDDIPALKACSLTCKAMFASTRHLIHQTLYLTPRNNESVLTREERRRFRRRQRWKHKDIQLRFLSCMGERGLLRYTRQVHIQNDQQIHIPTTSTFSPKTLLPHIQHFQSLDRVHALTIDNFDASSWAIDYTTDFSHFYPTLTSLTLCRPSGYYRRILQFALQFPNLEGLCLEWLDKKAKRIRPDVTIPTIVNRTSPVRGHLRLALIDNAVLWPTDFAEEIRNGFNFRSVELEDSFGYHGQHLLNACAETIEYLTIIPSRTGYDRLKYLDLSALTTLRRLTFRPVFINISNIVSVFHPILSLTSPVFCEFVLELGRFIPHFSEIYWGYWREIDEFLEEKFAKHGKFRLVIRTGYTDSLSAFQEHAKDGFPLLASRGCIHFETSHLIDKLWH